MTEYISTRDDGRVIILRDAPEPRALDVLPETAIIKHGLMAWKSSMLRSIAVFKSRFELADIDPSVEAEVMQKMVCDAIETAAAMEVKAMAPTSTEYKAIMKIAKEAFHRDPEIRKRVEKRLDAIRRGVDPDFRSTTPLIDANDTAAQERAEAEMETKAAAAIDDTRPPEWERSQRDGTVQSVPWRATEDGEADEKPVDLSKMVEILKSEGFESDGPMVDHPQVERFVHMKNEHRIDLNTETGRFRATSGYDRSQATGEDATDLEQWMSEENN